MLNCYSALRGLDTPIPTFVPPGIIARFSAMVARIKNHKNYSPAIGQGLGIVGSTYIVDPTTWKPVLSILIQASRPIIAWTKGKAGGIEIWVDRGDDKGFVFLLMNTEPNTTDPAPGTSAVWRYKAIYLLHDAQVGEWSDVISVTVGG